MSDAPQTRPCPDCASPVRTKDQSFCDSCGAFLRWDAPAAAPAPSSAPVPSSTPVPAPVSERPDEEAGTEERAAEPTAVEGRASGADGREAAGAEEVTAPLPAVREEREPATATVTAPLASAGTESGTGAEAESGAEAAPAPAARSSDTTARSSDTVARSLLVPVPGSRPAEPSVAAPVLPARPEAARPVSRGAAAPAPVEGGTPCPACALTNVPGRRFCRYCATPMTPERLSTAEGPYAGRRPALARDRGRWAVRALIVTGAVVVLVGGIIGGPPAVRAVQDHFAKRVPVHPVSWTASHSAPTQDPKLAGDGYSNTWWGTGYAGDSAGQYLEATFAEPTDLLSLLITPGSSKNTTQADGQATPRTFELVVKDSSGETRVSQHRVNDGGTQRVDVRVRDALSVRLVLRTAWRADPRKQVAVAELEFFGRSVS
ncbi:NADase-type glycan-binding domain-containing protein [Streptomyces sp. NPDC092359]|uniref:NADase-type glycan-binding domain-containing protein n=1 Tax=Streptomyces sp. NPDC092359 TaxID=3366014 RepID=UPI0038237E53